MKIRITLEIDDAETVENLIDVHPHLIFDDLREGSLMNYVNLVSVENVESEE
jgi:hypothetical protein